MVGKVGEATYYDNPKPWAADHCMHPAEVPGVFFCNRKVAGDDVWIGDIAPTVLSHFGVDTPEAKDGMALEVQSAVDDARAERE